MKKRINVMVSGVLMSSLLIMSIPVSAMTGSLDISESETYLTEPFVPTDEEITPQPKPDQHTQGYDAEYADPDESDNTLVNTISSNGFKIKVTETDITADRVYNSGGYGTVRLSDPKYGLVDRNGEFVFPYRKTWNRYVCSEGIVAQFNDYGYFYTNGDTSNTGFFNMDGTRAIAEIYDGVTPFGNGLSFVRNYTHWNDDGSVNPGYEGGGSTSTPAEAYLIDNKGNKVLSLMGLFTTPTEWWAEDYFSCESYMANLGFPSRDSDLIAFFSPYKTVDSNISELFTADSKSLYDNPEIKNGCYTGYMDRHGNVVIPQGYSDGYPFCGGIARVRQPDSTAVSGYDPDRYFYGKYGYINTKGTLITGYQYDTAGSFSGNGYACVSKNLKYGYINRKGETVIPFEYEGAFGEGDGLFSVEKNGLYGMVDINNDVVVPFEYNDISESVDGVIYAVKNGILYILQIDEYGEVVTGPEAPDDEEPEPTVIAVTGVTLPTQTSLRIGRKKTLSPQIQPSDATDQSVTWSSSNDSVASINEDGILTGVGEGKATIAVITNDGGYRAECVVTVISGGDPGDGPDYAMIKRPSASEDDVSTWDCIWFGNYWQNVDSNDDDFVDEMDVNFPIKWRVLDVDSQGNALLLSDKLLDTSKYNETYTNVTWETCTLRSFLNSYDSTFNACGRDYSKGGFLSNAFSEDEINAITISYVLNEDNPVYGTDGGNDTEDRIFCLSIDEATNADYGFAFNDFTNGSTSMDDTRVAYVTGYEASKHGKWENTGVYNSWWLRSPGSNNKMSTEVDGLGTVYSSQYIVSYEYNSIRPALRLNLSEASALWKYAGTVSSDGTVNEENSPEIDITGMYVSPQRVIKSGGTTCLKPVLKPEGASESFVREVHWTSSDENTAVVDDTGMITGINPGSADIKVTVRTEDGLFEDVCRVTVINYADPQIKTPITTENGLTTWDCILFGNYWQNTDSNGDGIVNAEDGKDPIKWRVLDIDENGNALLMSDSLLDRLGHDSDDFCHYVTWKNGMLRSFLNCYDGTANLLELDYSTNGFLKQAFNQEEAGAILISDVVNDDNPVCGINGGKDTEDKVFCLSIDEVMNPAYGFVNNEFGEGYLKYKTEDDPGRVALSSAYIADRTDGTAGVAAGDPDRWCLRSPGSSGSSNAYVGVGGYVDCSGSGWTGMRSIRPALRLNLVASLDLWEYAGTISSDGTITDGSGSLITGISIPSNVTINVGNATVLITHITPSDAPNQEVIWKSSDEQVASVDSRGRVTGVKAGTAVITVTTVDGERQATCDVTVTGGTDDVETEIEMIPGELKRLEFDENGRYYYGISWSVTESNPKGCVTVNNGVVTAKTLKKGITEGKATVQATYNGRRMTYSITVNGNVPQNESMMIDGKKAAITATKTLNLNVGTKKSGLFRHVDGSTSRKIAGINPAS